MPNDPSAVRQRPTFEPSPVPAGTERAVDRSAPRQLLVTVDGAASMLNVGRSTLYQLIDRGDLRPVHIGRSVRFRVSDLEFFVEHLGAPHRTSVA